MRIPLSLSVAVLGCTLLGCTPTVPDGRLACTGPGECPPGWSCLAGRCFHESRDGGGFDSGARDGGMSIDAGDAGARDSGTSDSGSSDGGGTDAGMPPMIDIEAGGYHACATLDGALYCWGDNLNGQLGRVGADATTPVRIDIGGAVGQLSVGVNGTCAIDAAGVLRCWGPNDVGQIGDGTVDPRPTPVTVTGGWSGSITQIDRGWGNTCVLTSTYQLWCWGDSRYLNLGTLAMPALSPIRLFAADLGTTTRHISTFGASCVVTNAGAVRCWGQGMSGGNGDGTTDDRTTPGSVMGISGSAADVLAGAFHACARNTSGEVFCWGHNVDGEVGNGSFTTPVTTAVPTGITDAAQLSVGYQHTCIRSTVGAVWCWGLNDHGAIGDGTLVNRSSPTRVSLPGAATDVSAGRGFTCAAVDDGSLWCWGSNDQGQLGDGTTADRFVPGPVAMFE